MIQGARGGLMQHVVHVGLFGELPGGMAQVVNRYLAWSFGDLKVSAMRTTRRRHDPLSFAFVALVLTRLTLWRVRRRRAVFVFHLSERGSFVREGGVLLFARLLGFPTVAHLHGAQFVSFADQSPRLTAVVLRSAQAVAALSAASARCANAIVGPAVPVFEVPNGVDVPRSVDFSLKTRTVVFGGEVGLRKGADVLAGAWRGISGTFPNWTLVVVGPDGGGSRCFRELDRANVVGPKSHSAMLAYLRTGSVAVLPSRDEMQPMFLLEAAAAGCALVGTDVGEVGAIVGSRTGRLVKSGSSSELASALTSLLSLPLNSLEALQRASHTQAAERYSEDAVKRALLEVWRCAYRRRPDWWAAKDRSR